MRSPEHRQLAQPRAGRQFEDELQLHYLSPGAFTVLPTDNRHPPDPPTAPEPYRLTPSTRRHKNQSFAIIGDVDQTKTTSRSSSPTTGRVSPFRGRGFNPIGSRHASPSTSPPPPEDARISPTNISPSHSSKIPKLKRRPSNGAFGEKVYHYSSSPTKRKISNKLSQSLTDLQVDKNDDRLLAANKRTYSRKPAFQRLSPIIGSSPEPSQSLSSPSRIPKSRSTPPSRKASPNRNSTSTTGKPPISRTPMGGRSRNPSQSQSRNQSRNTSREPSPTKTPTSPSRIPITKYGNVQARVNSFNKAKPKVPPKNQVVSEQSEDSDASKTKATKLSVGRTRTNSRPNLLPKTGNYSNNNYNSTSDSSVSNTNDKPQSKNINKATSNLVKNSKDHTDVDKSKNNKNNPVKTNEKENNVTRSSTNNPTVESPVGNTNTQAPNRYGNETFSSAITSKNTPSDINVTHKNEELKPGLLPSTTTVVSSTTSTVAQPLKIETNLNFPQQYDNSKPISPMIDGRVLSATSVSNAINRMNDTVLDSQTLMKEHGFSKPSPAATAIITVAKETNRSISNPALDTKNATTALPVVEPIGKSVENEKETVHGNSNHNNNHTNNISHVMSSKALEMEVQKHMQKLITPEHMNEKMRKSRTVVASDVQPIRITVREKPSDVEVQSGNIRLPVSATNGINERPR
ncbi:hypothetical protein JTB14_008817 [Gonioctena quinquepunctata]|nr:hypothetical protein JTB14_008817 [Gonioctena quinquepunctata]